MHEVLRPDGTVDFRPDADTPFRNGIAALRVTQAEAEGIRAFIRELKSGIYIKCARCEKLKYNVQTIRLGDSAGLICDECANA